MTRVDQVARMTRQAGVARRAPFVLRTFPPLAGKPDCPAPLDSGLRRNAGKVGGNDGWLRGIWCGLRNDRAPTAVASLPRPSRFAKRRYRFSGGWGEGWFLSLDVDVRKLPGKRVRANIKLPERVLAIVDEAAKRDGETRSGYLVRAALGYVGEGVGEGDRGIGGNFVGGC